LHGIGRAGEVCDDAVAGCVEDAASVRDAIRASVPTSSRAITATLLSSRKK